MGSNGSKQQSSQPIDEASCLREKKLQEELKAFQDQLAQKNQEFQQSQMMLQELVQSQIDLTRKVNGIESSSNISRDNLAEQLSSIKQDLSENLHASRISKEEETNLGQIAFEDRIKEEYSRISEENSSKIQENYTAISTRILNAEGKITALTEDLQESKKYHGKIDENAAKIIEIQASANEEAIASKIVEETNQQFQKGIKPVSGNIARLQSDLQKQLNKLETLEKNLQEFIKEKEKDTKDNNKEDEYKKGIEQSLKDLESKIGQVVEKQKQLESSIAGSSEYAKEQDVKNIRKQLLEVKADVLRMEKKKSAAITTVEEGVVLGGTSSDAIIIEETTKKPSLPLIGMNKSTIKNEGGSKLEKKISISSSDSEDEEDSEGSSSGSMPQKQKIIVKGQQSKNMQEIIAQKKLEIPKSNSKSQLSLSQSSIKEEATPSQKQKNKNNNNNNNSSSNNSAITQESTPKNSVQTFSSQIATKPTLGQTPTAKNNATPSQRQNTSGTAGGVQIDAQNPFKVEGKKGNKNFKPNKQE